MVKSLSIFIDGLGVARSTEHMPITDDEALMMLEHYLSAHILTDDGARRAATDDTQTRSRAGRRPPTRTAPRKKAHETPNRRQALGAGLAVTALAGLSACGGGTVGAADAGKPVKGGTLRVGITGGNSADTIDAHIPVNNGDVCRSVNLYNALYGWDDDSQVVPLLAESFEANDDSTVWTCTLKEGIKFSDGKPITPEDVVFSFKRINDPDDPKTAAANFTMLDKVVATGNGRGIPPERTQRPVQRRRRRIHRRHRPRRLRPEEPGVLRAVQTQILHPAQSTVLVPNDYYFDYDKTYLDEVELLNFNDSRRTHQRPAIDPGRRDRRHPAGPRRSHRCRRAHDHPQLEDRHVAALHHAGRQEALRRCQGPPGIPPRRRSPQMIEQVLSGYGTIGNDMFGPLSENYPKFPQRKRDIDKAKKLLAEAGYPDGLEVELVTAPIQSGAVEAAQVFAQQAADAGITVKIRKVDATTFFGDEYLEWDFAQDFWYTRDFMPQASPVP